MKILLILVLLVFQNKNSFCQFSKETIDTDSSEITIIKNSLYKVHEEIYKKNNLIWMSVRFIDDTNQVHKEGWRTKKNRYLGVWKEYTISGELKYEINYDLGTCVINKKMYPNHEHLNRMKNVSDSIIISAYSKEFFDKHVRFDYTCFAYDEEGYVGSWLEPLKRTPTKFLYKYNLLIDSNDWYENMICVELGKNGEYISNPWNNYGFENVGSNQKTFLINRIKAITISETMGLQITDSGNVSAFLKWIKFKKSDFYNGEFKYYVIELKDILKDIKENARSRIEYKYNVYIFNPWTGDFIEKKKMKRIEEWEKNSGSTSDFLPDE